jgi:hypothetical protein
MPYTAKHGGQEKEVTMKKIILFLIVIFSAAIASAEIEQHQGFPVRVGEELQARLLVQDINGDGKLEIIAVPQNRIVKVFYHNGTLNWENTGGKAQYDYGRVPLASDLNGDNRLEILSYGNPGWSDATFHIWDAAGNNQSYFKVGKYIVISSPAITSDGTILTGAAPGTSFSAIVEGTGLHAFNFQGTKLWYLELGKSVNFFAQIQVADMDADSISEAVVLTQNMNEVAPKDGKVWLVKVNSTARTILWSRETGGDARSAAIGDVNGDGRKEIVAVSSGGVYIFDRDGNELNKFAIKNNPDIPSIWDIDNNSVNEVLIASSEDNRIYIISNGTTLNEFYAERITGNLALGDVNSDGKLELAGGDLYGNMYIWDNTGRVIEKRNIARKYDYFTSAIIADLEGDGNKEIILGNKNGNIFVYTAMNKPKDTTPPVTTDNADGLWHNSNVTVTLAAEDAESKVASTYYSVDGSAEAQGTTIVISSEGNHTVRYYSVDNAGNREADRFVYVKIDLTAPVTTDNADDLWHNSSVIVVLTPNDSESGTAATYYSVDGSAEVQGTTVVISGEGNHSLRYYSVDNAGNRETDRIAYVKIDLTAPETADNSDGEWHNSSVNIKLSSLDNLSGVNATNYRVISIENMTQLIRAASTIDLAEISQNIMITLSEEGIFDIQYHSVDNAGNVEPQRTAKPVRLDRTPPVITGRATVPPNANGWYNGNVTINFTAEDALSGVKTLTSEQILILEGPAQSVTGSATDKAGNNASFTVTGINIDKTSPAITGTAATLPNAYGWYNTDVNVSFDCSDDLSGVESCTPDTVISNEGAGMGAAGIVVDNAGNSAGTAVVGINIDKTPPALIVNSPQNKTYLHSDIIKLVFSARDERSGINYVSSTMDGSIQVSDGQVLEMLGLSFGEHEFTLISEDKAGNLNSRRVNFNVIATIESLEALTKRGSYGTFTMNTPSGSGIWITGNGIANSLMAKINSAKAKISSGQRIAAKSIIEAYINEVEAQSGKAITIEGAGILVAEATYVIEHL